MGAKLSRDHAPARYQGVQLCDELRTHAAQLARLNSPWGVPGAAGSAVAGLCRSPSGISFTLSMILA